MRSTGDGGGAVAWARLETRDNALNAIRLVLAAMVIVAHAWLFPSGHEGPWSYMGSAAVDGFFVLSGFLVAGSRTRMGFLAYFWRRVLRIMPGFWACLVVTAFAIAPLSAIVRGLPMDWRSSVNYVTSNAALSVRQWDISDLLSSAPVPMWDSPLWSLVHEFRAYLIAGVFLTAVRWRRSFSWGLLVMSVGGLWVAVAVVPDPYVALPRLLSFFAAGMVLRFESPRIRLTGPRTAACAAVLGGLWVHGSVNVYTTVAPLILGYLLLWLAATVPVRLGSRNDLSYGMYIYGAPVQQFMVSTGPAGLLDTWGFALLSLVTVLPLAGASWFLVERPALRLRRLARTRPDRVVSAHPSSGSHAICVKDPS